MPKKLEFAIYIQEKKGKTLIPRLSVFLELEPGQTLAVNKLNYQKRELKNIYEVSNKGG